MQITPDVSTHAIEWSYGEYVEPLSVHVVETDATTVLVGGGDETVASAVGSLAREYDVEVVIAEHAHVDHYGAIPALREALDVTVAIPSRDADALRAAGIDPDILLEPGDERWGIEPIATPGHTPGNMAYRYDDCVFAGDTVVGSDSAFAAQEAWHGPLAVIEAVFNDDDAQARRSVSRLAAYDIETVLVSHGSHVLDSASEAIETVCSDLR